MKVFILTGDEGEIVSCWSSNEQAEEENARRGNEYYIEEQEIDPPYTVIPEGYVKGLIYHVAIHKISGEIIKDDITSRSRSIVYRDPEYLKICGSISNSHIQVYSAKSMEHAEEIALKERQKWCESRSEANIQKDLKEINRNPRVEYIKSGDVYEEYVEEGFLDANMQVQYWRVKVLENNLDIHEAFNKVMKSPGKKCKFIKRGDIIILEN